MPSRPETHSSRRGQKMRFALRTQRKLPSSIQLIVFQMYLALRAFFQGAVHLSVAFDASRVGCRQRLMGYIARPDNYGGCLPPMARLKQGAVGRLAEPRGHLWPAGFSFFVGRWVGWGGGKLFPAGPKTTPQKVSSSPPVVEKQYLILDEETFF